MRVSAATSTGHAIGFQALRAHVDVMGDRMADDFGLLVDLLGHEVAVIALFGEQSARRAPDHAPLDRLARHVPELRALARHRDPVALLEIGDAVGERGERQRVGAQIHLPLRLALAIADRERRALSRADQQVLLAVEQIDQREGAAHALQRRMHRLDRRLARRHLVGHEERRHFRIGLGGEAMALGGEFLAQRLEILDDPVVHDREAVARVRVRVPLGRLAVRRPAGVADADPAAERRALQLRFEVLQLALGAQPRHPAALQRCDARRVVAAIFQPLQRRDDLRRDRALSQNADDSAHCPIPGRPIRRRARVRPVTRAGSSHVGCANVKRGKWRQRRVADVRPSRHDFVGRSPN